MPFQGGMFDDVGDYWTKEESEYRIFKDCGNAYYDAVYDNTGHKVALIFDDKFKKFLKGKGVK